MLNKRINSTRRIFCGLVLALAVTDGTVQAGVRQGLKETVGRHCLVGVAVNDAQMSGADPVIDRILKKHFNALVAENCMKAETIQPREGHYCFEAADRLMDYAEQNDMTVTGHCLVWHSQSAAWMFTDSVGRPASRDLLIERMRTHIHTLVGRYRGRIKGWDVVNEAIEDDGTLRHSPWMEIIGPGYIELAFRFAHEADPDAELYYNDYSMANPARRKAVCDMVARLRTAGCRIDAVGMQSHNGLDWPDLAEYEKSIDAFAACGVKVMITELDINMLPAPDSFGGAEVGQNFEYDARLNPYTGGLPRDVSRKIDARWPELFRIYRRHSRHISRICMWGVTDGDSWLNSWPVKGRTAYPLLFGRDGCEKDVVSKINRMYRE